jgi:hypothetical protein
MTQFTAAGYLSNAGRTEAEEKQAFEDNLAATKQLLGGTAQTTLTLVSDQITPTGSFHLVETQAAAATDNCAQILQTNLPDGSWLIVGVANATHVVTFKHAAGGAGQLTLVGGVDFVIDDLTTFLILQRKGTLWEERGREFGADKAAMRAFYAVAGLTQNTYTGRQEEAKGASIASAATLTLGVDGNFFHVTGSGGPITGISSAPSGTIIRLSFEDFSTLTHNGSALILCPPVTRVMVPAETIELISESPGVWRELRPYQGTLDSGAGGSHNASQAETALYTGLIVGKTLGVKRRLRWEADCTLAWRNNVADTLTIRMKYATTIATVTVADPGATSTGHPLRMTGWLSNLATGSQVGTVTIDGTLNPVIASARGALSIDSTVNQNFQITAQFTAIGSPTTPNLTVNHFTLELV